MHLNHSSVSSSFKFPDLSMGMRISGILLLLLLIVVGFMTYPMANRFMANWATTDDLKGTIYYTFEDYGFGVNNKDVSYLQSLMKAPGRYLGSNTLPKLYLDIKFKYLQTLTKKRNLAMSRGELSPMETDGYVPASIRFNNSTMEADIRLKGWQLYHVDTNRWSLRVKIKGDDHLFGMRRFSLHHPKVRDFQNEPLFMETLRYYNIMAPRTTYVQVVVNGNGLGIMQIEDHFSKELLEHQRRKEGIILKLDESNFFDESLRAVYDNYHNAGILPYRSSRIARVPALHVQNQIAHGLLRGFMDGHLKASDVFDVDQMGQFLAVAQLWGVAHTVSWRNMRFYLNPITLRLEPIGYDTEMQHRYNAGLLIFPGNPIASQMLQDPEVERAYQDASQKIREDIDGPLIRHLEQFETRLIKDLHNEFVLLAPFDFGLLKKRVEAWPTLHDPGQETLLESTGLIAKYPDVSPERQYPTVLHLYTMQDSSGRPYLEYANMLPHKVDIVNMQWVADDNAVSAFSPASPVEYPILLAETPLGSKPESNRLYYTPPNRSDMRLDVTLRIHGGNNTVIENPRPYFPALTESPFPQADPVTILDNTPVFLTVAADSQLVRIKKGTWQIPETLIIPKGYRLHIPPGTTLQFGEEAGLFVFGAMLCEGTIDAPIVMEGLTRANGDGRWMGVAVFDAAERSVWRHVQLHHTTGIRYGGLDQTGGVIFYRSDVTIQDCVFDRHQGEDALNIIHAEYLLDGVRMQNMVSDGFDSDFSQGEIVDCLFENIGTAGGGDAIDFSGSRANIVRTEFKNILDKAVSIGEKSEITAEGLRITSAGTGIACKDNSLLDVGHSSFIDIQTAAIMAYIKKPEYGPAHVTARNLDVRDGTRPVIVQTGSEVRIDGKTTETVSVDVEAMYDTIMKKGL